MNPGLPGGRPTTGRPLRRTRPRACPTGQAWFTVQPRGIQPRMPRHPPVVR
ncbi:hypothetical protein GZL_07062 [Streptomyces sp. 769]|nr:hypothetical protein GZL_07062 [Streptomyces sp. 769]